MNPRQNFRASSACLGIKRVCSSRAVTQRPWGDRPGNCETRCGPNGPLLTDSRACRPARIWTGRLRGIVLSSREHAPHPSTAGQRHATSTQHAHGYARLPMFPRPSGKHVLRPIRQASGGTRQLGRLDRSASVRLRLICDTLGHLMCDIIRSGGSTLCTWSSRNYGHLLSARSRDSSD
jgi:hypothetical protein